MGSILSENLSLPKSLFTDVGELLQIRFPKVINGRLKENCFWQLDSGAPNSRLENSFFWVYKKLACVTYSPDFAQWKWGVLPGKMIMAPTASRTEGGNAGNGFQSTSSDKTVLKTSCPSWWLDFALLSTPYGASFLRHTNSFVQQM